MIIVKKMTHKKTRTTLEMVLAFFITGEFCIFALIDGGDEENRTPVRKRCHIDFSERSQCLSLRDGQTQTTAVPPILEKIPLRPPGVSPLGIPLLASYPLTREISRQRLALSC